MKNGALPAPLPAPLLLPLHVQASTAIGAAKLRGFPVGGAAKKAVAPPATPRIGKPTAKGGQPPQSLTSTTAAAQRVRNQHLKRSLG